MPIVSTVTGRALPGVYLLQTDPPPQASLNVSTGVAVLVAEADWGPVNETVQLGSLAEYIKAFGKKGNGFAQAFGFFTGGHKSGINGGGADLRMIRIAGTGQAAASATIEDAAEATVGTITAKYKGTRGNDIKVVVAKKVSTFDLTVIPFDGLPSETFLGLTAATAAAAITGHSAYVTYTAGASTELAESQETFLSGGANGTAADSDYQGVAGPPATGLELAKTVTDANFVLAGKMSAVIKTAMATTASALLAVGFVGPNDATVTPAAAIAEQTFANEYLAYVYNYVMWSNPVTGAMESLLPAGDIAGALANGEYWQNPTGISLGRALSVANAVSDANAESLAQAGIIAIMAGKSGIQLRNGTNTSSDSSKNQVDDTRIRVFLAKALESSLQPQWTKPLTDDWYDVTEGLIDQLFNAQPDEVIRRRNGAPGHAVTFDKSFEALNKALIYIQATLTGKALQIVVNAQIGRSVELTIATA
jgi:hypothetical protein